MVLRIHLEGKNKIAAVVLLIGAVLTGSAHYDFLAAAESSVAAALTIEAQYPGLAGGILKSAKPEKMPESIVLKTKEMEIPKTLINQMVARADAKLRPQLEKNFFFLLEQETTRAILYNEAKAAGFDAETQTPDQTINLYLDRLAQAVVVSETEAQAFYAANKAMMGEMPFEQVKESIHEFLLQQKRRDIVDAHIRNLGQRNDIRVNSEWVKAQYALAKDNPVEQARMSGKPTLIEFGATGCIPCDMMQPILDKLRKKYPQKLNVVFVHVRENQILTARYGIRSIPVQAFFDKNGQEVFRHKGFYAESEVVKQLKKIGVHD